MHAGVVGVGVQGEVTSALGGVHGEEEAARVSKGEVEADPTTLFPQTSEDGDVVGDISASGSYLQAV
jgi:hypothetical protein